MKKLSVILALVLAASMLIASCAPAAAPAATAAPAVPAATVAPAAAATTAPAAAAPSAKGKVMGIVMPNADHGFTGESIAHAQAFAKEMAAKEGFTYTFLTAGETSEQNNQVDTLINQKVDVIVMWPINGDELRSAAQKIVDAKIPLVIYDRLIKGPAKLDIRLVSGVGARKENLDTFADVKTKYNIAQVTYAFSPAMIRSAVQLGIDILDGKTPSGLILGPTVEVDNSSAEAFRTNPIYVTRYSLPPQ